MKRVRKRKVATLKAVVAAKVVRPTPVMDAARASMPILAISPVGPVNRVSRAIPATNVSLNPAPRGSRSVLQSWKRRNQAVSSVG